MRPARPITVAAVAAVAAVAVAALVAATAAPAAAAGTSRGPAFRVTSPAFRAGGTIPEGFTCDGANASPPLRWRGVPKKAKELALVMDDPDTAIGTFTHWVVWGLDPSAKGFPEQTLPAGAVQGSNQLRMAAYQGPCPPAGDDAHRYRFTLHALSRRVRLTEGATLAELRAAMRGHVLARARVTGLYARADAA